MTDVNFSEAIDLLAAIVALIGALGLGLAALALHRMPDVYSRLSATSKAVSLGAALLLAAVAIDARESGVSVRAVAGMAFLLLTSPLAGHVLARAAWRAGEPPVVVLLEPFPTGPQHEPVADEDEAEEVAPATPEGDPEREQR